MTGLGTLDLGRGVIAVGISTAMVLATIQADQSVANDTPQGPFERRPQLHSMPVDEAHQKLLAVLEQRKIDPAARERIESLWADAGAPAGGELLELVASSLALADERAGALVALCRQATAPSLRTEPAWLAEPDVSEFERSALRLYYGRWLAQQNLYDESNEQLAGLEATAAIDPATLLFYQAVNHHQALQREAGLNVLRRLLADVADVPQRYTALASLMEADLKALEDESLDHIARRMHDIERRLELGQPGVKTKAIEAGVIASLDKLIDQLEKQQQQQQQQQSSSGGSSTPQNPASDSRIMGGSGRGETTKRDIGDTAGWGALPPKERQDALQQIGKDFPSHYRDAVEQYFRRLATENRGD